jgi:RNA polymerase sigma factor (sigma-70 family)
MARGYLHHLISSLRRVASHGEGSALSDVQLLERFAATGDEAAFELLAWRHGPMVLGVCRRVLGDVHEVEDAFQATFLVLARKAASAARHRSAGGWLYTVAYRVALRARARRAARTGRERPLDEPPLADTPDPAGAASERETKRVIDEEVNRLPEKYRIPFVLFHLEGRSCAEVARELGCPVGTVESWLTRARQRLQRGLKRRGLVPTPGLFAALGPQEGWRIRAPVLAGGREAVSTEATALAAEVLRGFGAARARVVTVVLLLAAATGLAAAVLPLTEPPKHPEAAPPAERATAAAPRERATIPGRFLGLNALALSPDGPTLAVAGNDANVTLWDVTTGRLRNLLRRTAPAYIRPEHRYAHEWPALALAFSPDGKTLASGSMDQTVKLWDVTKGEEKAGLPETLFLEKATFQESVIVYSVAFSPDGKLLAAAGGFSAPAIDATIHHPLPKAPDARRFQEYGAVRVRDLATRKVRTFFRGGTGRVTSVAFSPDGKTLAAGQQEGTIRLWDVATGRERACLRERAQSVRAVAFSPDGRTLASVQEPPDDPVKLWDLASGRVRARLAGHAGPVFALAFSPDGTLATAGNVPSYVLQNPSHATGEVRLWDTVTGRPRGAPLTFRHEGSSVAFGGGGRILAAGGTNRLARFDEGYMTLWDMMPPGDPAP